MAYMMEDRASAYHIPVSFRLKGELSVQALNDALDTIIARHDILRTRYVLRPDGELVALVDEPQPVKLEPVVTNGDPLNTLVRATEESFDLEVGPLLRVTLLKTGEEEHYLHLTIHHIITDGWSIGNLIDELTVTYNASVTGSQAVLPVLAGQYRDYAYKQRARDFSEQEEYWTAALAGAPEALGLRTDRPRSGHVTVPGRSVTFSFQKSSALKLARGTRATLFMVLLAAYAIVLGRRADATDVIVGAPVAGRTDPTTETMMGSFINTVVMRTDLTGNPTFEELVRRVRRWTLSAFENQHVPFQHVAAKVTPRTGERMTLIQAWLALQNFPNPPLRMKGLVSEDIFVTTDATKFDVTFYITEYDQLLELEIEYDSSLFDEETMRDLAAEFAAVLDKAAVDPECRLVAIGANQQNAVT